MANTDIMLRYGAIIKKLKKAPATFKEIEAELAYQSELHGNHLKISEKTFERDRKDIFTIYKKSIDYNFSTKKYSITEEEDDNFNDRLLDAFDTLNALNSSVGYSNYLDLEQRKAMGNHNFHGILHAIKNRQQLQINYQSYWYTKVSDKTVEPYLLKEFKNRWYLIAKDINKNELRTFGLDRINEISFSKKKFTFPTSFKPKNHFKDSFGIIRNGDNKELENVVLHFNAIQGKYIKSLPFHSSQEVLSDDENGLTIQLKIYVTFDFEMEILSYGFNVEVLEPASLRKSIKEKLKAAVALYEKL